MNNFKEYSCQICGTACHKPIDDRCATCQSIGHLKMVNINELENTADELIGDMMHNDMLIFDLKKENEIIQKKLDFMGSDGKFNSDEE